MGKSEFKDRIKAICATAIVVWMAVLLPLVAQNAAEEEGYDETKPVEVAGVEIPDHFPRLCRRFSLLLGAKHFKQMKLDAVVSAQAWTNYLNMLDYDRSYFLQSDIDTFEPYRMRLCEDLRAGNLEFPIKAFNRFRERLENRAQYVEDFLSEDHDYDIDEDYVWKRKDLPWPADEKAQDDLWRRRMKNDILTRVVARDYALSNNVAQAKQQPSIQEQFLTEFASAYSNCVECVENAHRKIQGIHTEADQEIETFLKDYTESHQRVVRKIQGMEFPFEKAESEQETVKTNHTGAIDMSPEAVVSRRYKQYCGIIRDADADYVIERFLGAFMQAYDPHSSYMPPTRVDDFNIDMNLKLVGIGATLQSEDGMAKIVDIMPGGPAGRDTREIRLRENDKIFAVGQGDQPVEDIVHLPLDKIVKRIRGDKGTKVVLHVISAADPSGNTTKVVDLIRDDIKMEESAATGRVVRITVSKEISVPSQVGNSEKESPMGVTTAQVERAFGYVRLPTFYGSATANPSDPDFRSCTVDICKIISRFNPEVEGMVLDLRDNGGGSLREAVTLAGSFIKTGPVVIVREIGNMVALPDQDPAVAFRKPMVVLINRASASASEIVAAALQDYGRAVIIGDSKSHGKGTVQNIMPLFNDDEKYGSMRITIASFHRINGGSTQNKGVSSDIVLPSVLEHMDIGEDKLPNALPWTSVPPTRYQIVYPMGGVLPMLAEKSAQRLENNAEWKKHMKLVDHWREVSERTSVSLSYGKRWALVKEDDAFGDMGEDEEYSEEGEETEEEKNPEEEDDGIGEDIVLREAINILADLVDVQGKNAISERTQGNAQDWVHRLFK